MIHMMNSADHKMVQFELIVHSSLTVIHLPLALALSINEKGLLTWKDRSESDLFSHDSPDPISHHLCLPSHSINRRRRRSIWSTEGVFIMTRLTYFLMLSVLIITQVVAFMPSATSSLSLLHNHQRRASSRSSSLVALSAHEVGEVLPHKEDTLKVTR